MGELILTCPQVFSYVMLFGYVLFHGDPFAGGWLPLGSL